MKHLMALLIINSSSVVDVYDGDTIFVDLPNCNLPIACERVGVRIKGIDAPEIKGKCISEKWLAILSRNYVRESIRSSSKLELKNVERGKYYRLASEVWIDDKDLAQSMIEVGLARPYDGGKRRGWCD